VRATAIIPVKRFRAAKQRLLETLDSAQRTALVEAMLTDVLGSVTACDAVERVIVVTGERRAERIALRQAQRATTPLEVLREPADTGHSDAATLGIIRAKALGADCVALLPGDCPLLDSVELDAAIRRMAGGRVAVVPDRHGTGTNALLLSPPDAGAQHLKALAAISRVTRDAATLERLRGARSRDALAAVLMGADEREAT